MNSTSSTRHSDAARTAAFRLPVMIGEELARTLSDRIICLDLRPGMHLTEDEVCSQYAVRRSPVREAFRTLEADELVTRLARRGVRVTPMSRRDLDEVYACCIVLEGLAAREAVRHATESDLSAMHRLLDNMRESMRKMSDISFFNNGVAFTNMIHSASANRTLLRITRGIEKRALRYRYVAHSHIHEMLKVSLESHSQVFDAIVARKPAQAERFG